MVTIIIVIIIIIMTLREKAHSCSYSHDDFEIIIKVMIKTINNAECNTLKI